MSLIYTTHAINLMKDEDVDVLLHRDHYFDVVDESGTAIDPELICEAHICKAQTYRRVRKRFTPGMFEIATHDPSHDPRSVPAAIIVRDDDGPFGICGRLASRDSAIWATWANGALRSYTGFMASVQPMVVRKSLFRFSKCESDRYGAFWTLRRPSPFDRRGNFLRLLVDYNNVVFEGNGAAQLDRQINELYGLLLAHADRDCLRTARKWPQHRQAQVMTACVEGGEYVRQLFDSFPMLAWYLYVRTDVFGPPLTDAGTIGDLARKMVEKGVSLKEIAKFSNIPYQLRKVDPYTASETLYLDIDNVWFNMPGGVRRPLEQINGFSKICSAIDREPIPKDPARRRLWSTLFDYPTLSRPKAEWLRRHIDGSKPWRLTKFCANLVDWMNTETGDLRWRPEMSWREACRLSKIWHRMVAEARQILNEERAKLNKELDDRPFPDPWIEPWERHGWYIEYLADREQLAEHGKKQKNCVGTYSRDVAAGKKQIYSASYEGDTRLTIEIRSLGGLALELGQVRSKCNRSPDLEEEGVAKRWFYEMSAEITTAEVRDYAEAGA